MKNFTKVNVDGFSDCHVQGIAIDTKREYMYFSFTTSLLKTDLDGNIVGSVSGIIGHLGCIAYNPLDGRVYASLEYNNDAIGNGILEKLNKKIEFPDRFYVAVFDVENINRLNMDAEKDGIMKAVLVKEACKDYTSEGHRYGCSGIDGVTFAPTPGTNSFELSLYVAYGIYGDKRRKDNDHQIILRYDANKFIKYELPLSQEDLHISGPENVDDKYFIYTGNTTYGIQNLEYDADNNCLLAAVYSGNKLKFPNYSMFAIDLQNSAEKKKLKGIGEMADTLPLKRIKSFKRRGNISGSYFPYGSTGMIALGDNRYLFSEDFKDSHGHGTTVYPYRLNEKKGFVKEEFSL